VLTGRSRLRGTAALIDVGASTTTVVIVTDAVPQFVRIIPAGGAGLTQALTTGLEVDETEAETIKRSLGLATTVSTLEEHRATEIIIGVTRELLGSIRNTISYFGNTRPESPVEQIVLTGGGAQLPQFAQALAEITRVPVGSADASGAVRLARSVDGADFARRQQSLSVALGLALGCAA
jgi:type IV pilus assembly protein PilM